MWNDKKVVVSLTSYPKRISNVALSIFYMLKQSIIPDEVHLWLAEDEFPKKEGDLPEDLCTILEHPSVFLHWVPKNTYCFKRHEIFKLGEDFYCFFIDDDLKYDGNLIKSTLEMSNKFPNAIINYTAYGKVLYRGKHQLSSGDKATQPPYNFPTPKNRWCGQSMIPSWVYPKEIFDADAVSFRETYCPVCDETWFTQYIIKHNIGVINNRFNWGAPLNNHNCNQVGIVQEVKKLDKNGLNFRDRCLIKIFEFFPENKKYYEENFNYN